MIGFDKVTQSLMLPKIQYEYDVLILLQKIKEFSPGYLYPMIKLIAETAISDLTRENLESSPPKCPY